MRHLGKWKLLFVPQWYIMANVSLVYSFLWPFIATYKELLDCMRVLYTRSELKKKREDKAFHAGMTATKNKTKLHFNDNGKIVSSSSSSFRNAGTLDQHLTKKGDRELGNYLMASTWPHNKYNKYQQNGYHWTNSHKKYQNYLEINYGTTAAAAASYSADCEYIMGK